MKTEIDLRPPEFIKARRGVRLRFTAALLLFTAAGIVFLYLSKAESRIEKLSLELDGLRTSNQMAAEQIAPLDLLKTEIRVLEEKENLNTVLQEQRLPWSEILQSIITALPENFFLTAINFDDQNKLTAIASGPTLSEIAAFSQELCRLRFIRESTVRNIALEEGGHYRFSIDIFLDAGGRELP